MSLSETVRKLLAEADWLKIRNRALVHARWIEFANRWILPNNIAEDTVHDAIRKVLDGTRRWDPNRVPDLDYFVVSVVRSDYDNLFRKLRNQPQRSVIEEDELVERFLPTPEEALELKHMVQGALYQLRTEYSELYDAFLEFERLGLFDGRTAKLVASDLGMSQSDLSKKRSKMVAVVKQYLEAFGSGRTPYTKQAKRRKK